MAKGADWALTKGLAGSRQAQITMPMKESTKNSVMKRKPRFLLGVSVWLLVDAGEGYIATAILLGLRINVRLIRIWKRAEQTRRSTIIHQRFPSRQRLCFERGYLRPVHAYHEQACYESAEDLTEDVMWYFFPWETLPCCETNGDCGVEVSTRSRSTGDDGESDTDGETPTDLEDAAEGCDAYGLRGIEVEGGYCCYAGEAVGIWLAMIVRMVREMDLHVEKDACCFSHAFSEKSWSDCALGSDL